MSLILNLSPTHLFPARNCAVRSSGDSIPNELLAIGIGVLFSILGKVFRLKSARNLHKESNRYTVPRSVPFCKKWGNEFLSC
jgi:hypothetical protein